MNGKFYFLDTNAIIQLLRGNKELQELLQEAEFIACSIISKLEYLSFQHISQSDIKLFNLFVEKIELMELPSNDIVLHQQIINIRKDKNLKLPDAIIVGCSEYRNCTLITADKQILKIDKLNVLAYKLI